MLVFDGGILVNFRDHAFEHHGYRWVDVKRFRLVPPLDDDRGLLAALIGHVQFRDAYAGAGAEPDGVRHGPYWLSEIGPDAYRRVTDAVRTLRAWADQFGALPAGLAVVLEREVYHPVRAAVVYRLGDLGEAAYHDYGGLHGEFHEFVLVDRAANTLTLLVAADD